MKIIALAWLLCFSALAFGQSSSPSNQTQFSLSASVASLSAKTDTVPVTDLGGTFKVTPNFSLRSDNLLAPSVPNFSGGYFGGANYFIPSKGILAKTNFDPAAFQFYLTASGGEVMVNGAKHAGYLAGGGVNYDPTGSGHFTINLVEVRAARLPGVASGTVVLVSGGLKLGF